ncbi:MAG TPA: hypothetical protein VM290_03915 [Gaiellaceae bacterium]|nr:hypothetical protein [Gaiellaceae bacterium]
MKRFAAAVAAIGASLALTGSASAIDYGVTEDVGKIAPTATYDHLQNLGMTTNVMSVTWNPLAPTAMPPDLANVVNSSTIAASRGVEIILAVYQGRARGMSDTPGANAVLANWVVQVLRACPACKKVIYLNEPNQTRFWQPVFNPDCTPASPAAYTQALAAGYDAIKAALPGVRVYGLGLSPRGNDRCDAPSNVSHSPSSFLLEMGKAYKAIGRNAPLMDALSFHPYPNVNTDPPMKGYQWPNIGVPNLDRLKQVFEDAFGGTAQPTFRNPSFKVALDEVGWQVDTAGRPGYHGNENVPVVDEATQARYYAELVKYFACDPAVESLNFFHLVDEEDRDRFQSGLLRADWSKRASYDSVKAAIVEAKRGCQGQQRPAGPPALTGVLKARAVFKMPARNSVKRTFWSFNVYAEEAATYEATLKAANGRTVATTRGQVKAYFTPLVKFPAQRLAPGQYRFEVTLSAVANPSRKSSFRSGLFRVG